MFWHQFSFSCEKLNVHFSTLITTLKHFKHDTFHIKILLLLMLEMKLSIFRNKLYYCMLINLLFLHDIYSSDCTRWSFTKTVNPTLINVNLDYLCVLLYISVELNPEEVQFKVNFHNQQITIQLGAIVGQLSSHTKYHSFIHMFTIRGLTMCKCWDSIW